LPKLNFIFQGKIQTRGPNSGHRAISGYNRYKRLQYLGPIRPQEFPKFDCQEIIQVDTDYSTILNLAGKTTEPQQGTVTRDVHRNT
jgi:hypothetical protein